jgi:hypothetical protein
VCERDPEQLAAHELCRHHPLDPGACDRAAQCRNLCQRFGGDEPDASRLWVGHAYERDVRLRFSNGERTDALAVDREAVVQRAVRRVADARDRLAEEAVHQVFQVTRQRPGVSTLALGDLQIPRGAHHVVALRPPG